MTYSCYSGNFSSRSLGSCPSYPLSCRGTSSASNLVYSTGLCSPSTCQLSSTPSRYCQEACYKPSNCQMAGEVSSRCQSACYVPRTTILCSPCQRTYPGSSGFGARSSCSLRYGSRSCYSQGFGSRKRYSLSCGYSGFRPLNYRICGFPSTGYGSGVCNKTYFPSRSCLSSCYRPACGSGIY
ncbi:keratin-associated protein 13-3-like [Tenrec ecaudatus]|uniref:keratin-associated protein 13-3-like n=1 Tax=Tenrec ecaudatus TaxID=94439 RepID=UPI003F5AB698